jgi:BRCT domain type II-containing protein
MPPKKAAAAVSSTSKVHAVVVNNTVDSIFATEEAANAHADSIKRNSPAPVVTRVDAHELKGGSITLNTPLTKVVTESKEDKAEGEAPKAKSKATKKEKEEKEGEAEAPKAKTKATKKAKGENDEAGTTSTAKTKTLPENSKAKAIEATLPENIKALLAGSGSALAGLTIVVTGVPPKIGRQNAERLVMNYGGKLTKSLSKNTSYVVVGRDAGAKKLEQISELGLATLDEDALIAMLEGGAVKRGAEDEEKPDVKKAKK